MSKEIVNPLGMVARRFTHRKKIYNANCVQLSDATREEFLRAVVDAGYSYQDHHGDWLIIRGHKALFSASNGAWIRVGENGVVKFMDDEEFKQKYEEI